MYPEWIDVGVPEEGAAHGQKQLLRRTQHLPDTIVSRKIFITVFFFHNNFNFPSHNGNIIELFAMYFTFESLKIKKMIDVLLINEFWYDQLIQLTWTRLHILWLYWCVYTDRDWDRYTDLYQDR